MGTELVNEPALWELARGGDSGAFAMLYDRHRDRVFGQALRLMRTTHDAEDVTAVVFLELWRRRKTVTLVNETMIGWLLVTTNYVAHNFVRSMRRYRAVIDRIPPAELEGDEEFDRIDEQMDSSARGRGVNSAFAQLSSNDQNIITLCVLEEFSLAEAASALRIPVGTVKSRLSRAKQRLSTLTTEAMDRTAITSGGAK
ncbi:sigma-70 family RNA polymerase sigma factor [Agreia sp. VKM Ac-1783]|uniref:RNA polymerase sigma factor n=1 Tax=Agreia sp. VKM Ac-1783 TaxID=1938889 RepID=UPI000A2AC7B3|nr:sigma-70 family RNA polymerase sigma factor [Agreia sp. VKM Ac-1783]SMQ60433.1 RNA polymerase sigma-70 factor, ECF subfamily [Agreia sp. VKM Ac-1783]